jgi:predicted SprT family Zn-dependent metalloprotease
MALLGVPANYTKLDVQKAFRRKAKHHHPDVGGRDGVMRALIEAKELLLAALANAPAPENMPAHATEQTGSYEQEQSSPFASTPVEYGALQAALDHFNKELFDGKLPDVFLAYQRKAHMRGHFAADRYSGRIDAFGRHELALNPDSFINRTDAQITSTLVHEMVHHWQHLFGKTGSRGYHNREWAAKMKSLGLQPSSTGDVGGTETGQQVTHYIIPGGPFSRSYDRLAATGWKLNLQSAPRPGGTKAPPSKVKFTCPKCGQNIWGKPDTDTACRVCNPSAQPRMVSEAVAQSYDQAAE